MGAGGPQGAACTCSGLRLIDGAAACVISRQSPLDTNVSALGETKKPQRAGLFFTVLAEAVSALVKSTEVYTHPRKPLFHREKPKTKSNIVQWKR